MRIPTLQQAGLTPDQFIPTLQQAQQAIKELALPIVNSVAKRMKQVASFRLSCCSGECSGECAECSGNAL